MPVVSDTEGRFAPAIGVEVLEVRNDTTDVAAFGRFPGAHDVVVTPVDAVSAWPALDTTWWLVSPSGHRVEAITVHTHRGTPPVGAGPARAATVDDCDGAHTEPSRRDERGERGAIHLAVGDRDSWLVHAGRGWLLEPTEPDDGAGVEGLLVRMTEPSRGRDGVTLYFAVDQAWAPLVRGAAQLMLADVPGRPTGLVERCVETAEPGQDPQMLVDVHLRVDPVLALGAVYRLQPRVMPGRGDAP